MKREAVLEKQQKASDYATEHADRPERNGPQRERFEVLALLRRKPAHDSFDVQLSEYEGQHTDRTPQASENPDHPQMPRPAWSRRPLRFGHGFLLSRFCWPATGRDLIVRHSDIASPYPPGGGKGQSSSPLDRHSIFPLCSR